MAPAWLDSLSEDWPSQAGSEPSHSPTHSIKNTKTSSTTPASRSNSGRVFGSVRQAQDQSPGNSSNILNERSVNEINIFGSRHSPSKLSNEYKFDDIKEIQSKARHVSMRSISTSSVGSVVHNTVERQPQSTSPGKNKPGDTPEWRRRIIEGQLAYGEQCDLFTSARTGLENMFNPPAAAGQGNLSTAIEEEEEEDDGAVSGVDQELEHAHGEEESLGAGSHEAPDMANDMTMPSSPPIHSLRYDSSSFQDDEAAQQLPQRPRENYLDTLEEEPSTFEPERTGEVMENGQAELLPETDEAEFEEDGSVHRHSVHESQADEGSASYDDSQIRHPMDRESRVISGQSVLRNESFSAILISPEKDKGGDGAVFGPVELPSGELKRRLENLRWNQMVLADDANQGPTETSGSIGGRSLNVDSTEEYEKMGGFINFRRGGRSADGSFRDRLLSPPIGNDSSAMFTDESLQASTPKQFPSIRIQSVGQAGSERSPQVPRVPNPSPEKRGSLSRQQHSANASPLKLFGPYDTFTNQTLMRRISQFEDQMSNGSQVSANRSTQPTVEEESELDMPAPAKSARNPQHTESRQSSTQFGAGDLDEYQFEDEQISHLSQDDEAEEDVAEPRFPEPQSLLSRSEALFPSLRSSHKQGELLVQRMRQSRNAMSSRPSTAEKWVEPSNPAASAGKIPHLATPRRGADSGPEGKRPRTSPAKDPTPKRRRTLHKSDVAFGVEEQQSSHLHMDSVHMSHSNMQSVIGRKRRDARDGDKLQYADSEVLASRDILTPHTPTASRRSSMQRENAPHSTGGGGHENEMGQDVAPADDRSFGSSVSDERYSAAWSDGPLPGPAGRASGPVADGDRKPSIRTEDFMNEAQKILAMIRSRGAGAQGGLESVEESEMETPVIAEQSEDEDHSFESTKEPFSRPPSREGKPVPRVARVQEDPELLARLKKYEERSDLDDIMTTTTRSINIAQNAIRAEKEAAQAVQDTLGTFRGRTRLDESDEISDPPNIRISMNPKHQEQFDSNFGASENPSQRSVSSGHSTGRSIPTSSSRGSESRKTIAPQNVSHLIPDQVGNMILDRDRNIWIKRRNGSSGVVPNIQPIHHILPSEGSEEDPFADIPDLSVDATMEFHRLKPPMPSPVKATGPVLFTKPNLTVPSATVEDASIAADSTVIANENADENTAPVEHEISINEDRVAHSSSPSRKRHLAISFSSPIASIIQDFVVEDDTSNSRLDHSPKEEPPQSNVPTPSSLNRGRRTVSVKFRSTSGTGNGEGSGSGGSNASASIRSRSASRGPGRSFSLAGQAFVSRPISRIEEYEEDDSKNQSRISLPAQSRELSLLGDRSELMQASAEEHHGELSELMPQRQASLSVLLTTPGPAQRINDDQLLAQYVGMLSLSPMSEFTIHQDKSLALEASYVLGDRHLVTGDGSKTVMSQNLRDLVDRIAEVQPFEPYWEDMEELDVQGKNLESLHKLNEFCPQLVTLDAAGNALRNLGGIPTSVRHLRIVDNQLSELTSWMRLANLQYLDISNNDIKTLSGLTNLVHLRSLKVDNCNLENLNGVMYHDALQTLRARGNHIETVDFDGTRLHKLVELDLENNKITTASNLDQLVSLSSLNLRHNALDKFTPHAIHNGGALSRLRTLNVSDNRLTALDVRGLPCLRVLFADRNRLARIRGFSKTPRLDSVSIREQVLSDPSERVDISSLYHAYEIRKLYLSGNVLESFDPPVDFLNLQLLELANCGLTSLPAKLGLAVPNLRKVNLNFNALADLSPLCGIARLKKVLAAGNRLAHAFSVIQTLSSFAYLTEVDVRDNPVTQGFYPHSHASLSTGKEVGSKRKSGKDKEAQEAAVPATEPFTLPSADVVQDKAYCGRLDVATGMRRRVYSQVFGDACTKLEQLDGLAVDRKLGEVRDAVWEALNAKGIVAGSTPSTKVSDEKKQEKDDSQWAADDKAA
ncbi:leucine-rich repeat protein [Ophiostoma piceae UAMH 11346]|uniref:Leucine-rich repeat protein n=1 Tax=Ophiostoma piceae (strain UAMH 11346) TaxID=1262450 RepID=S3D2W7_OPHP1|nr:leucine-rich repeat protein [Ophiostoma piceae UAMH 11346]